MCLRKYLKRSIFSSNCIQSLENGFFDCIPFPYALEGQMDGFYEGNSVDLIESNLYLGGLSAATDVATLAKYKITHILTIDLRPLPKNILELEYLTTKYIQLDDDPIEDLLGHFDDTNAFILDGLSKGAVLVHCFLGRSRSAAVVIAHIMKKHQLQFKDAFEMVKAKRSIIRPNKGFCSQLMWYEAMGCKVDKNNAEYRNLRLKVAAKKMWCGKELPVNFMDLIKCDPGLSEIQPECDVYQCNKCRRVLALPSNIITHKFGDKDCKQIYFLEPLAWMMDITKIIEGTLSCPQCNSKVGAFDWQGGYKCTCKVKVWPAFYLTSLEVDLVNYVKN